MCNIYTGAVGYLLVFYFSHPFFRSLGGTKDLDALFGKAKYQEMRRNFSGALELVNQAVVIFPNYLPSLIEKMKLQLALRNWEECVDAARR